MKEMKKGVALVIILFMVSLIFSCSDSDAPAITRVKVDMKAVKEDATASSFARTEDDTLVFTNVMAGVTKIELENKGEFERHWDHYDMGKFGRILHHDGEMDDGNPCDSKDTVITFEGEYIVDLLNMTSDPEIGISDIPPGLYHEIKITFEPILNGSHTFLIDADYTPDNGDVKHIEFTYDSAYYAEIYHLKGMQIADQQTNNLLVILYLNKLFQGIDFNQANVDNDGVIRINEESNSDLAELIADRFHMALKCGEDRDHDHEFDQDKDENGGQDHSDG